MQYTLPDANTVYMKGDSDILWITNVYIGEVYMFNITSGALQITLSGFNRPLGIEVDEMYVYVAENERFYDVSGGTTGTVAILNKTNPSSFTRVNVTVWDAGPYFLYKDSYGYLWYTTDKVVGIVEGINWGPWTPNAAPPDGLNRFLTEVPVNSSEIWFSGVGSAYVGMKETGTLGRTDINLDGKVDLKDYYPVCKWYGKCIPPAPGNCDVNSDGKIDLKDVYAVAKNYGKTL
jgi:hypothetical protein